MATIVSHAVLPIAIGAGIGGARIPRTLVVAGAAASMLPDADVVLFRLGATYDTVWAHRGFSHSIGFAMLVGLAAAWALRRSINPLLAFGFVGLAAASHGFIDMFTNGGHGVAILWPALPHRYFFEWRPIQVSPLSVGRLVARASSIARSEFCWIWVPAIIVALALRMSFHRKEPFREDPQAR